VKRYGFCDRGETGRSVSQQSTSDHGAVAVMFAILVPVFLILCGISVDVGRWYVEAQRLQSAADAAAMAGVTWLPQNPDKAFSTAKGTASINGFPISGANTVVTFVGAKPSQLGVTVSSTVQNVFGSIFGNPTTLITRAAMADYAAPAIMGSPCNALGNQPPSSSAGAQPVGTVIPVGDLPFGVVSPGYAACQFSPAFWMNIAGPATNKQSGDRYATKTNCSGSPLPDFCTGTTNDEYDKNGYVFVVRVQPSAVNQVVHLQLYDPAFVYTGDFCEASPTASTATASVTAKMRSGGIATLTTAVPHDFAVGGSVTVSGVDASFNGTYTVTAETAQSFSYANAGSVVSPAEPVAPTGSVVMQLSMVNDYAPTATDVANRYAVDTRTKAAAKTYCPGDQRFTTGEGHLNTSFVLRDQTDSLDPLKADPIASCAKQYASLRSDAPSDSGSLVAPTSARLTHGSKSYDDSLAQLFHQWVDFCEFIPPRTGDYYLQVRTNVPLVRNQTANYIYDVPDGNAVARPSTLDETGSGHNRFAIRASLSTEILEAQVSVAGWQAMSIYTNAAGVQGQPTSSTFNLVQVLPNSAGNSFNFEAYDNGDAQCSRAGDCTLEVRLPADVYNTDTCHADGTGCINSPPVVLSNCVGTGPRQAPLSNPCTFDVSGNNGRVQIITVPIPNNYGCVDTSPAGCWFLVKANYASTVQDTVTYGTEIIEDPVRLIQ
jgi:hypothetical protein